MPVKNQKQVIESILIVAQDWCDDEDHSTEFMIAYMVDMLVESTDLNHDQAHDEVMAFLGS